jgi:hypothetical protein
MSLQAGREDHPGNADLVSQCPSVFAHLVTGDALRSGV